MLCFLPKAAVLKNQEFKEIWSLKPWLVTELMGDLNKLRNPAYVSFPFCEVRKIIPVRLRDL